MPSKHGFYVNINFQFTGIFGSYCLETEINLPRFPNKLRRYVI